LLGKSAQLSSEGKSLPAEKLLKNKQKQQEIMND
jgi:hypothetical protein